MESEKTKELIELKDGYRGNEFERQTSMADHRFDLKKSLVGLRDTMAGNRHKERLEIIKVNVIGK